MKPVPVILDTDIGGDIDDTWALAMLLKCPELDPKLIVSDTGNTTYRATLIAKMLEVGGRSDVPVGIGIPFSSDGPRERQQQWIDDYDLGAYPGEVCADGVEAIVRTIMENEEPTTLIAIGPVPNIKAALELEPKIAQKTNFVGMHGSFNLHHTTNLNNRNIREGRIPEYNVVQDISAAQAVFSAPWRSATITPLDTCSLVMLEGERYQSLRKSDDLLVKAVMENYEIWSPHNSESNPTEHSSLLYDTVAIYLAFTTSHIRMEKLNLLIDDTGLTVEDESGKPVEVAMRWDDLEAYLTFLTERLLAPLG